MCYSKEVQLTTGSIILFLSIYYYFLYYYRFRSLSQKWLLPFLKNIILGFVLIGAHQIFEGLALITENQLVYKTGLVLSILAIYFFIRSLEVLQNRSLRSYIALGIIIAVGLHIFSVDMSFSGHSFYVQHSSAFFWAAAWMLLLIYFHICAFAGIKLFRDNISKKSVILYLLATLDISLILSAIYVLWGHFKFSVNVCTDSPSIWCTFYVVQVLALPFFLANIPKLINGVEQKTYQTLKKTLIYFSIALLLLLVLISTLPFFDCLSTKFVFP